MYTYGTYAFTCGRRQGKVQKELEASVDEDDLPKLLGILLAEVPDLELAPYMGNVVDQALGQATEKQQQAVN